MSPRPRLIDDRDVLVAVGRVVSRIGPARMTLADVAEESGLAPATLLQRFGSKRGLLLAFAASGAAAVGAHFAAARAAELSPRRALVEALVAMAAEVADPAVLAHHVALLAIDLDDPEFRHHAAAHTRAVRAELQVLVDRAVARGELAATARERLPRALLVTYNGALLTWAIDPEGPLADSLRVDLHQAIACHLPAPAGSA